MIVLAHVAGVPLEEVLASGTGAGTALLLARAWLMLRLRRGQDRESRPGQRRSVSPS